MSRRLGAGGGGSLEARRGAGIRLRRGAKMSGGSVTVNIRTSVPPSKVTRTTRSVTSTQMEGSSVRSRAATVFRRLAPSLTVDATACPGHAGVMSFLARAGEGGAGNRAATPDGHFVL